MSSAIGWGALAVVGGSAVAGSAIAAKGSKDAARIQSAASERASEQIDQRYRENKEALSPYSSGGIESFKRQQALSGAMGSEAQEGAYQDYRESPGVAFAREQGLRGINQQASATGNLGGGNRLKRLTDYSQGLALQDFNNYFNRLGSVTGVGLGATQALAGVGSQAATGQATMTQNAGIARAQGKLGASQAYSSGLSDLYGGVAQTPWGQSIGLPGSTSSAPIPEMNMNF